MTEFRPSRFEILPLVIKNLLIINVLVFLAQLTLKGSQAVDMEGLFALHHLQSPLFQPWQLITYLFMHGSFMHLLGNMFALWMFGATLETLWGPKRFITFYFLCGIGAALLQLASLWYEYHPLLNDFVALKEHLTPETGMDFFRRYGLTSSDHASPILNQYLSSPDNGGYRRNLIEYVSAITYQAISNPSLGASGSVFGILAAFVYLFPNTYLYFYFLVPIKAKWVGLAYFGYEIYSGILNNTGDNIAHWAHIGGALVGFLLVINWNKKNRRNFY